MMAGNARQITGTPRRLLACMLVSMFMAVPPAMAGNALAAMDAANGPACQAARPFYWEIGDSEGPVASGSVDDLLHVVHYTRDTEMNLASASKWITGAYMMQVYGGEPPVAARNAAEMLTGYHAFKESNCELTQTVAACFHILGNDAQDANAVGSFFYSGGNTQYLAADPSLLGLGDLTTAQLTAEVQAVVGTTMHYQYPALPAGLEGSAAEYAQFLMRLMRSPADGGLVMHDYLGVDTVRTLPCPANESGCSPGGTIAWHYGYQYWVEDNTTSGQFPLGGPQVGPGDGAYSSPGAYGFYPWISADKSLYGIVARRSLLPAAYQQSVVCGQAIRYAYTGFVPQ